MTRTPGPSEHVDDHPPNSIYQPNNKRKNGQETLENNQGHVEDVEDFESGGDYFDLDGRHGRAFAASGRDSPLSIRIPTGPTPTEMALTALQYLPMPLLVLSSSKTVVLANDAMGRLLSIDPSSSSADEAGSDSEGSLCVTDVLYGRTLSELGVDLVQNGTPLWVKWEVSRVRPSQSSTVLY